MAKPEIVTVRDHIAWSYANLARAHAAVSAGVPSYRTVHHMIRAKLFKGLRTGEMSMRSVYDDERVKFTYPRVCCYCGSTENIGIDHLAPKLKGGQDYADNLVWACRSCNSSKGARDMLEWMRLRGEFPTILLLRRYTKLLARHCEQEGLLDLPLEEGARRTRLFRLDLLPQSFPALDALKLWSSAEARSADKSEARLDG